jgi:hypothetical protein
MKYLLFSGSHYYPLGGMEDLVGSSNDITELKELQLNSIEAWDGEIDWYHLYNSETGEVIEFNDWDEEIDRVETKIVELWKITKEKIFTEYYTHEHSDCYKILDEFTEYKEAKLVLGKVSDGYEAALDEAIRYVTKLKTEREQGK